MILDESIVNHSMLSRKYRQVRVIEEERKNRSRVDENWISERVERGRCRVMFVYKSCSSRTLRRTTETSDPIRHDFPSFFLSTIHTRPVGSRENVMLCTKCCVILRTTQFRNWVPKISFSYFWYIYNSIDTYFVSTEHASLVLNIHIKYSKSRYLSIFPIECFGIEMFEYRSSNL